jgi:hypothetical protein
VIVTGQGQQAPPLRHRRLQGKCIEAAGGVGGVVRDAKWERLKSIRRVPLR